MCTKLCVQRICGFLKHFSVKENIASVISFENFISVVKCKEIGIPLCSSESP